MENTKQLAITLKVVVATVLLLALQVVAFADPLPTPTSDSDPRPPVAGPIATPAGLVGQAGIGGETAYGRAGVLELGGSAGLVLASDLRVVSIAPSVGLFLTDNFELSLIPSISYVGTAKDASMLVSGIVEPSYHLPLSQSVFWFMGMGLGASWVENFGAGVTIAPRMGLNVLVGRSGVLTPALSWQYTTHDTSELGFDETAIATVSSALGLNVGYTVMW